MTKKEWAQKVENITENALDDFWSNIATVFPEVKGGDFPPDLSFEMSLTMEKMVSNWLSFNHPTYRKENK
jgi:hypothetical protein